MGDGVALIQARHEEMAAFMACAQAKFTGEVRESLLASLGRAVLTGDLVSFWHAGGVV